MTAALLDEVTWTVRPGERWVVLGSNGAGKTTLLGICAGTVAPTDGWVSALGERVGDGPVDGAGLVSPSVLVPRICGPQASSSVSQPIVPGAKPA